MGGINKNYTRNEQRIADRSRLLNAIDAKKAKEERLEREKIAKAIAYQQKPINETIIKLLNIISEQNNRIIELLEKE